MKVYKGGFSHILATNAVPLLFIILSALAIPMAGYSGNYLVQEMVHRMGRDSFLVLALIIPIIAGMGLNFGMVLGAMAGQMGLIFILDWGFAGNTGLFLAMLISTPLSILLGYICGAILNRAKGREMVTGLFLGFFFDGIYQLTVMFGMGKLLPITNKSLLLSRGYGVRNTLSLSDMRTSLDRLLEVKIAGVDVPIGTFIVIGLLCLFIVWFRKTKLGQNMRALGQDMQVAQSAGINVERTRIIAIVISTLLAGYGQIIFLQNIGTLNTYNSHTQAGMFAAAALLIGGATVARASILNVFVGVVLFHLMFVVSPMAGKQLMGDAQIGEYFRQFVSFGIIALALVLHAWKRLKDKQRERARLQAL